LIVKETTTSKSLIDDLLLLEIWVNPYFQSFVYRSHFYLVGTFEKDSENLPIYQQHGVTEPKIKILASSLYEVASAKPRYAHNKL